MNNSSVKEESAKEFEKYFSWASLKTSPPYPVDEISKAKAEARERAGEAYYIGLYCTSGNILKLLKRYNKGLVFEMTFNYEKGQCIGVESSSAP